MNPIPIRVLLLPKFETGAMSGDFPGEAQLFYEAYCAGGAEYAIRGGFPGHKLYVKDGVALYVTGMGKVNAALSLQAVVMDGRFDFSRCLFLSVGCGGSAWGSTVMGDVIVATAAVDYDLGHHADIRDLEPDSETTWFHDDIFDSAAGRILDPALTERIYALVRDTALETTENTRRFLAKAAGGAQWALRQPKVCKGTTVSGDNYWKGQQGHRNAQLMAKVYGCPDPFAMSEMEDAALAVALDRLGWLHRYAAVRVSVNMDVFMNGMTARRLWGPDQRDSIAAESSLESADIFVTAMENEFRVCRRIIDAALAGELPL